MREAGIRHDVVDAVMQGDNIFQIIENGKTLNQFILTDVGSAVIGGYKRANNILKAEEKKENISFGTELNSQSLSTEYDKNLFTALQSFTPEPEFENNLHQLSRLLPFIERFFENVIVNDTNPQTRQQRLNLLGKLRTLFEGFCDFSKIES
jgi:glycyl-tRNA synthetase beta chain